VPRVRAVNISLQLAFYLRIPSRKVALSALKDQGFDYTSQLKDLMDAGAEVEKWHSQFSKLPDVPDIKALLDLIASAKSSVAVLQLKIKLANTTLAQHRPKKDSESKADGKGEK